MRPRFEREEAGDPLRHTRPATPFEMAPGKATVAFLLAVAYSASVASVASALQSSSVTLEALLSDGTLRRFDRLPDYMERRQDGYEEPRTVYILGTNHRSKMSAEAA